MEKLVSMLPVVENLLVRQLGRYLQWPSFDLRLLKRPNESSDQQTCRGYLWKYGRVDLLNRAQLALFDYLD
jgi:hypothetical protein